MLRDDDRRAELQRPVDQREHALGVELGGRLVEQEQLWPEREHRRHADPLELAAGELVGRARRECAGADRLERLADADGNRARGHAQVLEPERDLVLDPRHHHLVLGILEERGDAARELGRLHLARVAAEYLDPAVEAAAVEVGHQPRERAQQGRLARARRPQDEHRLSRLERERDLVQGEVAVGIGEGQPLDGR